MLFYRVLFKRCKDSTLLPNNQEKKEKNRTVQLPPLGH
jgi:hypothetical protein